MPYAPLVWALLVLALSPVLAGAQLPNVLYPPVSVDATTNPGEVPARSGLILPEVQQILLDRGLSGEAVRRLLRRCVDCRRPPDPVQADRDRPDPARLDLDPVAPADYPWAVLSETIVPDSSACALQCAHFTDLL